MSHHFHGQGHIDDGSVHPAPRWRPCPRCGKGTLLLSNGKVVNEARSGGGKHKCKGRMLFDASLEDEQRSHLRSIRHGG